jgi:hypothetical protein
MKHPEPATVPDGSDCGPGAFHIMLGWNASYAPNNWWPWYAQIRGVVGKSHEKARGIEIRIRRIERKTFWKIARLGYLKGANLSWADLSWADLYGADLSGADLSWADLYGADLSWANLSKANLYGADLYRADLSGANLYGAYLPGARNLNEAKLSKYQKKILKEANK